jgi:signal transduction histidine kinase/ActR/RegA family two-component response regulator
VATTLLTIALAVALRVVLEPWVGPGNVPYITLFVPLVFLGWYAGLALALTAVVIGGLAINYLVLPPIGAFAVRLPYDAIGLVAYAVVGACGALLGHYFRRAQQEIADSRDIAKRNQEALQEADRLKTEFLATLAHELRNPLAPLTTSLELIKMDTGNPDTVDRARAVMVRQVKHIVDLVDDLLDVSRISRGVVMLKKAPVSVASVVNDAVETSHPAIRAQGHELVLEIPAEPIYVEVDQTRLAQVLTNLLSNAAKFSDARTPIRLQVVRAGNEVAISVEDCGIGIPAHMLSPIFDMFTQGDTSLEKMRSGLGVGLTVAKKLIELHGGTIEAHSDGLGMGSRFTVRLPVVPHLVPPEVACATKRDVMRAARRILIADDNRDAAISLALMLKLKGHETQTAYDGLEAMTIAETFEPDIAILDIGMPKLDGYQLCRRLRAQPWGNRMFMVALTGWGQDQDKQLAHDVGFDLHLVKPVDPAQLNSVIASVSNTGALTH